MKKIRKFLLKILLIWGIGHIITNYIFIWNVFDEIYYGYYRIKFFRPNYASHYYMPQLQVYSRDGGEYEGVYSNYYTEEYIEEDKRLTFSITKNSKIVQILYMKKQYLYDIILTDWFEANEGRSRFSMEHPGIYRYVE